MNYRNAKYIDDTNLIIDCEIEHPKYGWIPYTLNMNESDNSIDNSSLYSEMMENKDVSEFVPLTQEQLDAQAASSNRSLRDSKLSNEVDPIVSNPLRWADLSQENKDAVTIYRRALLDITTHVNWPNLKPEDWPTLTLV